MKVMKCPECEEVSTFIHEWKETTEVWAPVIIDSFGHMEVDYENREDDWGVEDDDIFEDTCRCEKCREQLSIDDIEVVEIVEVAAE